MTMTAQTVLIHSMETLGALDGPGLRCVVFLQGCPLRCLYCHNPDTQSFQGGIPLDLEDFRRRIVRMRAYFGSEGGVTFSGGEPLASPQVLEPLLRVCEEEAVHVAVDTAGGRSDQEALKLASRANLLLLDMKHPDPLRCERLTGKSLDGALSLLRQAESLQQPVWIRHVVVPNFSDSEETMQALHALLHPYTCIQKVELIPFHRLGVEKYHSLRRPYPMGETPDMDPEKTKAWQQTYFP